MSHPTPDERLLAAIWQNIRSVDASNVERTKAAAQVVADGADPAGVAAVMQAGALMAAFDILYLVAGEHSEIDSPNATTGWALVEADLIGDDVIPQPERLMDGIYEMLLTSDPTGRDAQDIV
jgi:hypothetical protein